MIVAKRDAAADWMLNSIPGSPRATPLENPGGPPERQRGLFNFLTWPFFLAQLFAAEEFFGGMFRPALAQGEEQAKTARQQEDADKGYDTELNGPAQKLGGAEDGVADPATDAMAGLTDAQFDASGDPAKPDESNDGQQASAAGNSDASSSGSSGVAPVSPAHFGAGLDSVAAAGSGTSPLLLSPNDASGDLARLLEASPTLIGTPNVSLVEAIRPLVGEMTEAVTDLPADLLQQTTPVFELVDPIINTATDAVTDVAGIAVNIAEPVLQVVRPALDVATDAVSDIADVALNTAAPVIGAAQPVLHATTDAFAHVARDAFETADSTIDTIHPALSATEALIDVAGDVAENVGVVAEAGSSPLHAAVSVTSELAILPLASGGIIAFDDERAVPKHDLFEGGRYTDYGLALRTEAAENLGPIGQEIDSAGDFSPGQGRHADTTQDRELEKDGDGASPAATPVAADLTGATDDIAIRASDELL